jgi:hypothetical protein
VALNPESEGRAKARPVRSPQPKGPVNWTFGGGGYRHVWVHKNGSLFFGTAKESDLGDGGVQSIGSAVVDVTPGDYFQLIARQTSSSTRTSPPTSSPGSRLRWWSKGSHQGSSRFVNGHLRHPTYLPRRLGLGWCGVPVRAAEPARSSGIPPAQKLWHVSKAHLLELSEEGFWRHAAVQPATLAAFRTRLALAEVLRKLVPIIEYKAAIVPRSEVPWLVESEEQPVMTVPVAKALVLEIRRVAELEHNVPVAEHKHETAVAEVTEVPRLEGPRLPKEATMLKLGVTVSQVQLRASVA